MSTPAGQMKPDRSAMDIHSASHQAGMTAAKGHGDALAKLHAQLSDMIAQHGQNMAQMQQPPQQGGDQQQAVWSAFPSTDPQQMQQALQQGANPEDLFWADVQKLHDMHMQQVQAVLNQLGAPAGQPMPQDQGPAPAVGGENLNG